MTNVTIFMAVFFLVVFQVASLVNDQKKKRKVVSSVVTLSDNFTNLTEQINDDDDDDDDDPGFGDPRYDEVHLVVQVTGRKVARWTIHGLWAEKAESNGPFADVVRYVGYVDCVENKISYNYDELDPFLVQELNRIWPTRRDGTYQTDRGFWAHEITRHGSCMVDVLGRRGVSYLRTAKELWYKWQIDKFRGSGKKYGPGDRFNVADLLADIGTGRLILECEGSFLVRIKFCHSKGLVLQECFRTYRDPERDCPARVSFNSE